MTKARDKKINELLEQAPKLPGIYIMKGGKGEILYIGKAKVLYNRVRSYFQKSVHLAPRTRILVPKIEDIRFLTTKTEQEALILESNFIKKHQPRYNVLLKDDKHYPYLRLTTQETYPRLEVVRRVKKDGATYFGPYTMVREVRETIRLIYKIFPLRQSSDPLDGTPKRRPCLNFQMGRCLAPCAGEVAPPDYQKVVEEVSRFLKGKNNDLIDRLKEKMNQASDEMRYEEAGVFRDKIEAVKTVLDKQKIISTSLVNQDVIACHRDRGLAVVQVLIIRNGKMVAEKSFKMQNADEADAETIGSFLKQYYLEEPMIPQEILLSTVVADADLIEQWLTDKRGNRVHVETPVRGQKRDLVRMAEENARFAVRAELDKGDVATRSLEELQETLGLRNFPRVIEGFDISNTMGQQAVGSMVRFEHARPEKNEYRRFKIKTVEGIDDYAMLSEVLTRRYMRLIDEELPLPDLVLIDGGKGHLNTAFKVLEALDIEHRVDLACIAKGKFRRDVETDEVFLPGRDQPAWFKDNSPSRFLLQRVRDESHRFAIEFHRKLRGKSSLASPLESIPGVGKKRRLALLKHFGSLEAIKQATEEEIAKAPGIPGPLASKIAKNI
ncbi:MAG: excinuclease ABC subunit UvrC [Candidatus Nitronauta litoralis]|uniref:UvrABC system protein C n=1 Tax=Candidatus Nitronauta litoralis TaxID=2705533 RepID=A0A7T0G0J9_9BACT|nr:MAG: excinuclease ABC subunit UvrC [Candidatus Nitronauta litoralis]